MNNSAMNETFHYNDNTKARILIIDDEVPIVLGIKRVLRHDYKIDVAVSAKQAFELIAQNGPYPVIISDLNMPEMNGIEFLSHVKRRYPETLRILLTGQPSMCSSIEAINDAAVYRLLQKPLEIDALRMVLESAITEFHSRNRSWKFDRDLWSHFNNDIKDPLRCLMGFADFMNCEKNAPAELHAYAAHVRKNGYDLIAMSEAAATLSEIESKRKKATRQKTCVKLVVRNVRKALTDKNESMRFFVKYETEMPDMRIDGDLFEIAIRSLLEDALQFDNGRDGPTLKIRYDADDDATLCFALTDKGPAIDTGHIDYFGGNIITETPFYRNRGAGLRLSLARAVAELHEGTLELFEGDGQTARLLLKIPRATSQ
ncbi:MAG: hybrid sensor histidine kinase/response regulator [Pseudomonadota bacterium]